jgi:prepilin-type N-terminal cleavage/methylation domain-containing protein
MKQQTGFSLIELLVVIAIILIIVAIAVPNLMRSQMAANEASAIESIRSITTAQATYAATYPDLGFAPTLASLGFGALPGPNSAGLLEPPLSTTGLKDGYTFNLAAPAVLPRTTYTVGTAPQNLGKTGQRAFCSDQNQSVRLDKNGSLAVCLASNNFVQ